MPASAKHVKPFVRESLSSKALYFSLDEVQSRMQLADPYALDLAYTRTMMGFLLFKPEPEFVAMIGLGGGSLAKFCWRYLPRTRIQVCEVNPHVVALRDEFKVPPDDERFGVTLGDGAVFVRHCAAPVDVLLVDGFDNDGLPQQLSSQAFYDDCRDALQPGGIMVVNLHFGDPQRETKLDRIRGSFNGAVLVVDDGGLSNSIVFACKGQALVPQRARRFRRPKALAQAGASQLLTAFALIASALEAPCP